MTEENKKKKEYLEQIKNLTRMIRRLDEQLLTLREGEMSAKSMTISAVLCHGSNITDMSDYVVKHDLLYSRIVQAKYKRIMAYTKILQQIEMIQDEKLQEILTMKYIQNMSFERIADSMGYSFRQIIRLHGKALEKFTLPE